MNYSDFKLTRADILKIEAIYLEHFRLRSQTTPAEDWFRVITTFMAYKGLELAPKGTIEKYLSIVGDN